MGVLGAVGVVAVAYVGALLAAAGVWAAWKRRTQKADPAYGEIGLLGCAFFLFTEVPGVLWSGHPALRLVTAPLLGGASAVAVEWVSRRVSAYLGRGARR